MTKIERPQFGYSKNDRKSVTKTWGDFVHNKKHCSPPSVSWMVKNTKKWRVQFSSLVSNLILCSGRYFGFIFFWKNTKNKFTPSLSLQKTSKCVITCKMKNTQFCSFPKSGLKFRVHNNFYHLFFPIFFLQKFEDENFV